jgi:DNA-binding MarR family transcriptional regulator
MRPEEELRLLILALQRDGERLLNDLLAPLAVTPSQAEVLRCLADARVPVTLVGLGRRLVCERGSPSRLVRTLIHRGWVESRVNFENRREVCLSLTPSGTQVAAGVSKVEEKLYDLIVARLGPSEQAAVLVRLRKLAAGGEAASALAARKVAQVVDVRLHNADE